MRRARNWAAIASGAVAWWLVSCRDIPSPGAVLSISTVLLPSPGLVVGDTMRDSTGVVAPLRIVAFSTAGDTVQNVVPSFVVIDTGAHLVGAFLVGDRVDTVRVVGSVDAIQSQPTTVKVTLSPDSMVAADSIVHHRTYSIIDTVVNADLNTSVVHRVGTSLSGVEAVIVRYVINRATQSNGTLVLLNGNIASSRDTTDAGGRASRTARLRLLVKDSLAVDTAMVTATSSYRGRTLGSVSFVIVFTLGPPPP